MTELRVAGGGGAGAAAAIPSVEFFRVFVPDVFADVLIPELFFPDRVVVTVRGKLAPEPRLRFLITSVFKLRGRTTPWSFKNKPHALQRGWPSGFRRHKGVVWVKQLVQVVGAAPSSWLLLAPLCKLVDEPCLEPGGEDGRLGATEEKPDA